MKLSACLSALPLWVPDLLFFSCCFKVSLSLFRSQEQCYRYWPEEEEGCAKYGKIRVTKIDEEVLEDHTQRVFKVRRHGVSLIVELLDKFTSSGAGMDFRIFLRDFLFFNSFAIFLL